MAMSLTGDLGCEYGGGVHCSHGPNKANFFGVMAYNRMWFDHDLYAVTFGGGFMNNPGRYLALVPPINGATAATGTPYFTENPGQNLYQWDMQLNFQYMPKDWITWWTEVHLPALGRAVLERTGRRHAAARQHRRSREPGVQQRQRRRRRSMRNEGGVWYPGSAHARADLGCRRHGQVLKATPWPRRPAPVRLRTVRQARFRGVSVRRPPKPT